MLKRDINFFAVIGQDSSGFAIDFEKTLKICLVVFLAIAIIILGLLSFWSGVQKLRIKGLENDIADLEEDLKVAEEKKQYAEQLQMDIDTFDQSINEFKQQARLTTSDIIQIANSKPKEVAINNFSYNNDTVVLDCVADDELWIADFAHALREAHKQITDPEEIKQIQDANGGNATPEMLEPKVFDDVIYTGVSKNADGKFNASVSVKLKSYVLPEPEGEIIEEGEETTEGAEK